MATIDEANLARRLHANELAKVGAHAIGVEKGTAFGRPGWVVVAYAEVKLTSQLPKVLTIINKNNVVEVPLVVQEAKPFEPQ